LKRFVFISLLIISGGIGVLFFSLKTSQPITVCGVSDFEPFCGTGNLTEDATKGKQLFNANCAACHKLDKNMTGPALRNVGTSYDSITIQTYLRQDKTAIKRKGFDQSCVYFPQLTNEDIKALLAYTN
jgi:cytochrome c551/c552